jgi:hypothetical protein
LYGSIFVTLTATVKEVEIQSIIVPANYTGILRCILRGKMKSGTHYDILGEFPMSIIVLDEA